MAIIDFRAKLDQLKTGLSQYFTTTLQKITTIKDRLNTHVLSTGNVHKLEPTDIGLGNVPDWAPATKIAAQEGVSNNAFMTPRRVDDYADEQIFKVIGDTFKNAADDL